MFDSGDWQHWNDYDQTPRMEKQSERIFNYCEEVCDIESKYEIKIKI